MVEKKEVKLLRLSLISPMKEIWELGRWFYINIWILKCLSQIFSKSIHDSTNRRFVLCSLKYNLNERQHTANIIRRRQILTIKVNFLLKVKIL
jgi:hypothetical protein